MSTGSATETFVALARPAELGALLRIGPQPLSLYWANPSRAVWAAGLGVAQGGIRCGAVRWLGPPPPVAPPGPWFGGWAFDDARPWRGFPTERWVLPEVLAWWDGARSWLAAFGPDGVPAEALMARLDAVTEVAPTSTPPRLLARPGARAPWDALVESALETLREGRCSKLVLARVVDADFEGSERTLLKALEARHPGCWIFLVRGDDGRAFIGASPETLLESSGTSVSIDALAGTAAKGQGERLLRSEKELREHRAVVDGIRASLAPFAAEVQVPAAPVVKSLANVEHLFTPVRARLHPEFDALTVARALHPTPAVAGTPKDFSVAWLRRHEGFARGWYAGAVGAQGAGGVTLAVGLRSALLDGDRAQLFVGAGVVSGSTAEAEWDETERKSWALSPAYGHGAHAEVP